MTTLRHRSRAFGAASLVGLLLFGVPALSLTARAAAVPRPDPADARPSPSPADDLARARLESDLAQATLASLRRMSEPAHLLDPLPPELLAGVGDLQAQYAELERRAAGYRATLGNQHPTLRGAEEVMADLRRQILEGVRRVMGPAEQDAARKRATVAALERQVRAADATASLPRPTTPSRIAAAEPAEPSVRDIDPAVVPAPLSAPAEMAAADPDLGPGLLLGAAVAAPALAALALVRRRRRADPRDVRTETDPVAATPMPPAPLPVVGRLSLREDDDAGRVRSRLARGEDAGLASNAAALLATLAAAADAEPGGPLSVAVTSHPAAETHEAEALAVALAAAAAEAGRRVLLVDGSGEGRLAKALGHDPVAAVVTIGGTTRGLIRVALGTRALVLLAGAVSQPAGTIPHLSDLDGFETIVIAGEGEPAGPLAGRFALLTARAGTDPTTLQAARRPPQDGSGRPCGIVLIERCQLSEAEDVSRLAPSASRRRRPAEAATARLGLRRTFDPVRRRA